VTQVYGHGDHPYFSATDFPDNLPSVWWDHWARIPSQTGHAVVIGEWGGLWNQTELWGKLRKGTKVWQQALQAYLLDSRIGSFYWTLNDNSFSTGSLFNDYAGYSVEKLEMLASSPRTLMPELEARWHRLASH